MRPTKRLLFLLGVLPLLGLLAALEGQKVFNLYLWYGALLVLILLAVGDCCYLLVFSKLGIKRKLSKNLPIDSYSKVSLQLHNLTNQQLNLELFDYVPAEFKHRGMPATVQLAPSAQLELTYSVLPQQRGNAHFSAVDVCFSSNLGLFLFKRQFKISNKVRVYPNFAAISKYILLASSNNLSHLGVQKKRRRGSGQDFHQLREYRLGDSAKVINWKSSAKMRKLIAQEYQDERNQQIVFLLDCGRRMRHETAGIRHLDQALNAMLLLAYVGARQGDAVGFLSFAGSNYWQAPSKGKQVVNRLLSASYAIQSSLEPPDYLAVAKKLMSLQQRRSLLVLITNTKDEDNSELQQAIQMLGKKHLLVLADLQEDVLKQNLSTAVHSLEQALLYHSSLNYLEKRTQTHRQLQKKGVICIDTPAKLLPARLINQYLEIKNRAVL